MPRTATLAAILAASLAGLAAPAFAQDGAVLLDYRDTAFLTASSSYDEADRERIAKVLETAPGGLSTDLGQTFEILGDASGAFSDRGANERIYLIQSQAPAAIDPFPKGAAPLLLVLAGDKPVAFHRLSEKVQYQRLVAAADGDGDGRAEVLLETSFMNMGQSVTSLDVVKLGEGNAATVEQTMQEVYMDACENPQGEKSRTASTIRATPTGFKAEPHDIGCD